MNEIMLSGLHRAWTIRKLSEDKRWDADAVMRMMEAPCAREFELKKTADPVNTDEATDRHNRTQTRVAAANRTLGTVRAAA